MLKTKYRTALGGIVAVATLFVWFPQAGAQDLDRLVRAMDENRREEILRLLPEVEARFPDHPLVLYLRGLLTEDADLAIATYEELVQKHPDSKYADDALFRVCQYYFAKGLYATCRLRCENLLERYPVSDRRDDAEYLIASCFFAAGQFDSAYVKLRGFLQKYPNSPLLPLVQTDLQTFRERTLRVGPGGESKPRPEPAAQSERSDKDRSPAETGEGEFVVQVGAFREKANALRQKRILDEHGYSAEVITKTVGGKTYFAVFLGRFGSYEEADAFGRELSARLGLPYRVERKP